MAYGLLQLLLPCQFWVVCIRYLSMPVSPLLPSLTQGLTISFTFSRVSTQILSHHIDDFILVSTFFLFALGCLNILLSLIFCESAKAKHSISSWHAKVKGVLPTSQDNCPVFVNNTSTFTVFSSPSKKASYVKCQDMTALDNRSWRSTEKAGYGFGRQGEKSYMHCCRQETAKGRTKKHEEDLGRKISIKTKKLHCHLSTPPSSMDHIDNNENDISVN